MTTGTWDLCVLGAGPAGYAAAMRAHDLGKRVVLIERDRVGGAVTADARHLVAVIGARGVAERPDEWRGWVDVDRRPLEGRDDVGVGDGRDLLEDRVGILLGQVADVDIDDAGIGHFVQGVAAHDPAEVDRGAVEEIGGLQGER